MSEIISGLFVIGVLLFYAGLLTAFLFWNLARRLRGLGKKRAWPGIREHFSASRFFNRPYRSD
jgi:hypothetical protein